jgi:hypothetical protein
MKMKHDSGRRREVCKTIGMALLAGCFRAGAQARETRPFMIFDGFLYKNKPDLRPRGLVPIMGSGELWRPGFSADEVDRVQVWAIFEKLRDSRGYYYLDIETWLVDSGSPEARSANIQKLTKVIDTARAAAPQLHLGFYGLLPGITYWPLLRHDGEYANWREVNRQLDGLAQHVDVVFPSLYTFYSDLDGWKNYARQTLLEARRYQKPVYPFLWPEFHDSNPELGGKTVPPPFWRAQLELCAEMADGVVLWGGWKQDWNEGVAWWRETLLFIKELGEKS